MLNMIFNVLINAKKIIEMNIYDTLNKERQTLNQRYFSYSRDLKKNE